MQQSQMQQLARFKRVSRFCKRHAGVLTPATPAFAIQATEMNNVVKALEAMVAQQMKHVPPPPQTRRSDARQALYAQVLTLHRIARIMHPRAGVTGALIAPRASGGAAHLIQVARKLDAQLRYKWHHFVERGAPTDCQDQLQLAMRRMEQAQRNEVSAREERARLRSAMRTTFVRGVHAVICLDVVVGRYCQDGGGRRGALLKQWREIVPRVSAPYARRPRRQREVAAQQNAETG